MTEQMARLYECSVTHQRLVPRQKAFKYRVFMIDVDLDELPEVAKTSRWLAHNRFHLFSIDDRDHINLGVAGGIRASLIEWLARQGIHVSAAARIRLITFPRVLGYGFNPVSFYYIYRSDGTMEFAVAEVVNTYREMKLYVVDGKFRKDLLQRKIPKNFYVSPFSDPGDVFDFRLGEPGQRWRVRIDDLSNGGKVLVTSVRGRARPLTSLRLFGYTFKYPLLSLKIIGLIHWHALVLWFRRVPFFRKSDRQEAQLDVLRRHPQPNNESP